MLHLDSFIDGALVPGDAGAAIARISPIDGVTVVGEVADASAEHARRAISAATAAGGAWAAVTPAERARRVQEAIAAARAIGPHDGALIAAELGKPAGEADGEYRFAAAFAAYCATQVEEACADIVVEDAEGLLLRVKEPYGVIAAITPWNAPVILAALKFVPALLTGNTMVLKPSPLAPLAVTSFVSAVAAQLPAGVLNVINGGPAAGEALVTDPRVDMVSFTGGPATARVIGAAAAANIRPTVMELGGNDAAVVLEDADFGHDLYERIVFGAFLTSGQVCMAIKRVYVPRTRHDEFVREVIAAAARVLRIGDPQDAETTMGPVVSAEQHARITALVADASASGGVVHEIGVVAPGLPEGGYWLRPTIVTGLTDDHELVREEQFGPTLPILAYDTEEEAIARANGVEHALASSVWSRDVDHAHAVARRLRAGYTFVNCHNRSGISLRAPLGGRGISGHGREFGPLGLEEYLQNHSINYPNGARPGAVLNANHYPTAAA